MTGLPDGRKSFQTGLAFWYNTGVWHPASIHPASQLRRRSKDPAYYVARVQTVVLVWPGAAHAPIAV